MMKFRSSSYLSYLIALSIFFSYVEACFPHFIPFLRLGLANIVVLSAFCLPFSSFCLLILFRSIISSLISGTLFSPFVVLSLSQSIVSGFVMYLFSRLNKKVFKDKLFSLYGISMLGSSLSAITQLFIASFYLGKGVYYFLGLMILFGIFSGCLTAFFAYALKIRDVEPELVIVGEEEEIKAKDKVLSFLNIFLILVSVVVCILIKSVYYLLIMLVLSFALQLCSGRKLKILVHLALAFFVILTSLFTARGEVLFSIAKFKITKDALLLGIEKTLRLSIMMALSLSIGRLKFSCSSFVFKTQAYLYALIDQKNKEEGKYLQKVLKAIRADSLEYKVFEAKKNRKILYYVILVLIISIFIFDKFLYF